MEIQPVISGEIIVLRPLSAEDAPLLLKWFFEPDVLRWLQISEDPPEYRTLESVRERFERMQADPWSMIWRIDTAGGQPIGQLEVVDVHPMHRRAEMHLLIGENRLRGRGHGTEAIRLALTYLFEGLDFRRVYLIVDEDNQRGIRCFEKAGLVKEGLLREHRLRNGRPVNMFLMGILAQDFYGPAR